MQKNCWLYLCGRCANSLSVVYVLGQAYISGQKAVLIRTASTRQKMCAKCREKFRDLWRVTILHK